MDASGLLKINQRGYPGESHGTTVRTAEGDNRCGSGRFEGDVVGSRSARDIRELGNTIVASRKFDCQGSIDTATAQDIQTLVKGSKIGTRACTHCANTAVRTITDSKCGTGSVVEGFMVADKHRSNRNGIVDPRCHVMVTDGEVLGATQFNTDTVSPIEGSSPVI